MHVFCGCMGSEVLCCTVSLMQSIHHTIYVTQLKKSNECTNTTTLQYYNTTTLQYCNTTTLQHYNTAILQYYNTTILQYCNTAILQHYNTTILQYYNTTIYIGYVVGVDELLLVTSDKRLVLRLTTNTLR